MRKILAVLVLLVCITALCFAVGCEQEKKVITFDNVVTNDPASGSGTSQSGNTLAQYDYTGSFSGNGVAWIDAICAADAEVTFSHSYNDYYQSESISKVSYKGITIENDDSKRSYLTYYCNVDDVNLILADVDPFIYNEEEYYLTVSLDKIPVSAGFKILFVQTIYSGNFESSEVSTAKAVMFHYVGA